ncbi:MAG TPA: PAS domain-containing protein [Microvirga sp.]|nr:PAS domain-containing protein [Microvirga sp.]
MSVTFRAPDLGSGREIESGVGDPFAAAFRTTRMPMLVTDPRQPDNPVVFVNDAFSGLTGYSRGEIVGRNCRFLQGPDSDRATVDRIREAVRAGESIRTEILNYKKDGTPFWNSLVISPVRNEAGELLYFFASQFDVSEKKDAELELIRAKALLEEEVSRRTRDLRAALDQKTALLHEVDHRVKNNLQVISSLVLLKARRLANPEVRKVLHDLAERISALSTVHRLLYPVGDVSRFGLRDFLGDLTSDLATLLPAGQVEVELRVEPVAVAAAKAAPLALLVNELVSNAFKHAYPADRRGRVLVEVTKPDRDLRIVVEDDGVGIAGAAPPGDGFGKTLIEMLARQLKARVDWGDARPGTRAVVTMPLDAEEAEF